MQIQVHFPFPVIEACLNIYPYDPITDTSTCSSIPSWENVRSSQEGTECIQTKYPAFTQTA